MATPRACSLLLLLTLTTAIRCQQPLNCTDILEENARQKAEIKWLNNVITNNISQLNEQLDLVNEKLAANEEAIQHNVGDIKDNTDNIGITAGRVTTNVAHNATTNLPRVLE